MTVPQTQTLQVIKQALRIGYRANPETGEIYGKTGKPLTLTLSGSIRYPQVSLHVPNVNPRRKSQTYAIPAHKFMGYVIWGEQAFAKGVQVRHLNGVMDIRAQSLSLGSARENMSDIPPKVRSTAARQARQSQGITPSNAKLSNQDVCFIRKTVRRAPAGGPAPGELERLAAKFRVSKSVISGIIRGVTYAEVDCT